MANRSTASSRKKGPTRYQKLKKIAEGFNKSPYPDSYVEYLRISQALYPSTIEIYRQMAEEAGVSIHSLFLTRLSDFMTKRYNLRVRALEPMDNVILRIPRPLSEFLDQEAPKYNMNRAQFIRAIIEAERFDQNTYDRNKSRENREADRVDKILNPVTHGKLGKKIPGSKLEKKSRFPRREVLPEQKSSNVLPQFGTPEARSYGREETRGRENSLDKELREELELERRDPLCTCEITLDPCPIHDQSEGEE